MKNKIAHNSINTICMPPLQSSSVSRHVLNNAFPHINRRHPNLLTRLGPNPNIKPQFTIHALFPRPRLALLHGREVHERVALPPVPLLIRAHDFGSRQAPIIVKRCQAALAALPRVRGCVERNHRAVVRRSRGLAFYGGHGGAAQAGRLQRGGNVE